MRTVAAFIVMALIPTGLFATGTKENPPAGGRTLVLYMLARTSGEAEIFAIERMDIPAAISLFDWTPFSWDGKEVSMHASTGYGINKKKTAEGAAGAFTFMEYQVELSGQRAASPAPKSTVRVSFTSADCAARDGSVLYQPERLAVILAVRKSGAASGFARIREITHAGGGAFSATVELR